MAQQGDELERSKSKAVRYRSLQADLQREQQSFHGTWQDCADHMKPRRLRLRKTDKNRGDRRDRKIIDGTAVLASRTGQSGMHAGITSPARPWFNLLTADPDLNKFARVKRWLHDVTQRLRNIYLRCNIYNALPTVYGDQMVFGTTAMFGVRDAKDVMRFYVPPVGSYSMALNDRNIVDTIVRDVPMTVRQVVRTFGDPTAGPAKRWANFSKTVRDLWEKGNLEADVPVCHVITANADYSPRMSAARLKRYSSCYLEDYNGGHQKEDEEKFLRESGFDYFPAFTPRWEAAMGDVYGTDCPGMQALGDTRALQLMQKRKAEAIEKHVRPPMTAPAEMRNTRASILPGDITYVPTREGQNGFKPAYEVKPDIAALTADIRETQQRISRAFYEDLFLMLVMMDTNRERVTAREIQERHEEKLLMLGPTLERENDELLDPVIDWSFGIAYDDGLMPPPPEEMQGVPLRVEYVSIMAQAQKMIGLGGLREFTGYVLELSKVVPSAGDKLNTDAAIDEHGDMTGVNPNIVRSDDEVAKIRQERAAQQQAAARAEQAAQEAKAVKDLAGADMAGDNALTRMVDGGAGAEA